MKCIICELEKESKSTEHIVPESFGNKDYVMYIGTICDECNARFSKFENTALTNSVFVMERARFGIETKKGHTAKGELNGLKIEGDKDFKENFMTVSGLSKENFTNFDPNTQIGEIRVPTFDKSEVATSKMLLKTGIESIYKSQRPLYKKKNFQELKGYLLTTNNIDWPFVTTNYKIGNFQSVPRFTDKHKLNQINCQLSFLEIDNETLLFTFKYGAVSMTINLLNRNLNWIQTIMDNDANAGIYPEHYKNKIQKQKIDKNENKSSR
jgi:hypothetical protein